MKTKLVALLFLWLISCNAQTAPKGGTLNVTLSGPYNTLSTEERYYLYFVPKEEYPTNLVAAIIQTANSTLQEEYVKAESTWKSSSYVCLHLNYTGNATNHIKYLLIENWIYKHDITNVGTFTNTLGWIQRNTTNKMDVRSNHESARKRFYRRDVNSSTMQLWNVILLEEN